jgi:hypothetical protein
MIPPTLNTKSPKIHPITSTAAIKYRREFMGQKL